MSKMTDEQKMRAIMVYPNAQPIAIYLSPDIEDWEGYRIHSICMDGGVNLIHRDHGICGMHINDLQILLRPVSILTDEECIEVARIASSWDLAAPLDPIDAIEWIAEIMNGNCALTADYVSGIQAQQITDYLRSINIITDVNGFNLVEQGIAILDETI